MVLGCQLKKSTSHLSVPHADSLARSPALDFNLKTVAVSHQSSPLGVPPADMEEDDPLSETDTEAPDIPGEQEQSGKSASKVDRKREKLQKKLQNLKDAYEKKGRVSSHRSKEVLSYVPSLCLK